MDDMVKKIAIIPARGGSKRIPNKNIIDFNGKPMIAWTIEAAKSTNLFDKIIVSTDSDEIREIAMKYGAEAPFLREKNADDHSPVSLATLEALKQAEDYYGEEYDHVIQLMANCPIRSSNSILKQYTYFLNLGGDNSLLSAFTYGMYNPFWAHIVKQDGSCSRLFDNIDNNIRSQDLPRLLCPTGATWISSRDKLLKYNTFYSNQYKMFEISWTQGIDIDDFEDLKLAKIAFEYDKL